MLSTHTHNVFVALQAVQEALKGDSIDSIKSATDALQQELMAMGQAVYAQPQAGGPQGDGPQPGADGGPQASGSKPDDPNVVDAEFTDSSEK